MGREEFALMQEDTAFHFYLQVGEGTALSFSTWAVG